jgi:hypothetical protein
MKRYFFILVFLFSFSIIFALPFGVNDFDFKNSTRAQPTSPDSVSAQAGNVTEMNVFGYSITQSWQGYFGNVSGTLTLADSANSAMYNWSVASPRGQIYSSTNDTVQWAYSQCFNYTASGTLEDDTAQAGNTSLYGLNLTQLEEMFNIPFYAVDGVNETFSLSGVQGHGPFYTSNLEFTEGECKSTRIFGDGGSQTKGEFEEILLYEPETSSVIFTSILDEDLFGFDGKTHDFQMLVLEDGHMTDMSVTPYYFYLEIE